MKQAYKAAAWLGAGALAVMPGMKAEAKKAPAKQPNIIFFLIDDMGWMDIACNGSTLYETPHIDRLASQGVRFTQGYSTCHVSSPARATIMTGRYPASINLTDWLPGRKNFPFQQLETVEVEQQLPAGEPTIAEVLKAAGYNTAMVGKWHLGEGDARPEARGFDVHIPKGYETGWPQTYYAPFKMNGYEGRQGEYLTDAMTREAIEYIKNNKDNPFFLYFSHYAVHDPIEGRPDLVEKYRAKIAGLPVYNGPAFILEGNPDDKEPLTREQLDKMIDKPAFQGYKILPDRTVKIKQRQDNAEFAAMVESVDQSLGRLVTALEKLHIDDNTVIIFFSDNGGMSAANFGNPKRIVQPTKLDKAYASSNLPLRGAKGWLYEGGIRVPMIVKWPGKGKVGEVCPTPVISTDFFPTMLEMAGVKAPKGKVIEGVSIAPLLTGKGKWKEQPMFWHFPHYSNHGMQSPGGAVRYGDWKLIEYFERGTCQLFNLKDDIGEQNDLAAANPAKVAELKKMLHDWRVSVGAHMMVPNPGYKPES